MDKEEALEQLREIKRNEGDTEEDHIRADSILIALINDEEIKQAYNDIDKWYA